MEENTTVVTEATDVTAPPVTPPEVKPETPAEKTISKSAYDKLASEMAEAKRQLKAKMTEDEVRAAEQAEREAELTALKRENALGKHERELISADFAPDRAAKIAAAICDGDTQTITKEIKAYAADLKKKYDIAALAGTPKPPAGEPETKKEYKTPLII